jgi:hypothetical protein
MEVKARVDFFGNDFNNRAEEAPGKATDFRAEPSFRKFAASLAARAMVFTRLQSH